MKNYKYLILALAILVIGGGVFLVYSDNNSGLKTGDNTANNAPGNGASGTTENKNNGTKQPALELVAENLTSPLVFVSSADGSGNMYVADQAGVIKVLDKNSRLLDEPFLDLKNKIVGLNPGYDERGLLGLAFHPGFKENKRFFVYYSVPLRKGAPAGWNHTSRVSEFKASAENPLKADLASEKIIMEIDQPQSNHNGGHIAFGPDGYLYIPLGDGGGANDVGTGHSQSGNGQDLTTFLGKILRIDVNSGDPYGIPADNPFNGDGQEDDRRNAKKEIYAYGFRNPYIISFDAQTGALYAADAGQDLWEEVDAVKKGGNYGWNIREGNHCFNPSSPKDESATCLSEGRNGEELAAPIIEFKNSKSSPEGKGLTIIGGYVYRGNSIPDLNGRYVFGSWAQTQGRAEGRVFFSRDMIDGNRNSLYEFDELKLSETEGGKFPGYLLGFGQDDSRELYILTTQNSGPRGDTGKIYKIISQN